MNLPEFTIIYLNKPESNPHTNKEKIHRMSEILSNLTRLSESDGISDFTHFMIGLKLPNFFRLP